MGRRIDFCGSLALLGAVSIASASAGDLMIRNGAERAFALSIDAGRRLTVAPVRMQAGSASPRQGEIMVSISTTHAVGYPKLHVYNRFGKAVTFKVAAMKSGKLLLTSDLCGHIDTDSWILLPSTTTDVRLSRFAALGTDCP